jgi:glutamyl-tRNA synthetase
MEDLDADRVRPEFDRAIFEDLAWCGIDWTEGPDKGGPYGPYRQRERLGLYADAFEKLRRSGWIYPCTCSRKDINSAVAAPHEGDEEPLYPGTCRRFADDGEAVPMEGRRHVWRFRVPLGDQVAFTDLNFGTQTFIGGVDFGDFVVWRHDGVPAYQLACVVDDAAMDVTEVVRGADLLASTARQLLLFKTLGFCPPAFYHCPLVTDEHGVRLAKRSEAMGIRSLREAGRRPDELFKCAI